MAIGEMEASACILQQLTQAQSDLAASSSAIGVAHMNVQSGSSRAEKIALRQEWSESKRKKYKLKTLVGKLQRKYDAVLRVEQQGLASIDLNESRAELQREKERIKQLIQAAEEEKELVAAAKAAQVERDRAQSVTAKKAPAPTTKKPASIPPTCVQVLTEDSVSLLKKIGYQAVESVLHEDHDVLLQKVKEEDPSLQPMAIYIVDKCILGPLIAYAKRVGIHVKKSA